MKYIITLIIFAVSTTAFSQTTQKLTASKLNEYGLIYTLPQTVIDVTVEAKKTVKTPGEFYRYSTKYLGITPITSKSEEWSLESVTVTPRGVADESEKYLIQFKSGSTPYILIDKNDFPLTVNSEDYIPSPTPELPVSQPAKPTILQTPIAAQAITEEMLQSTSSAKKAELAAQKIYELRQSRNDIISGKADQMPSDGEGIKLVLENLEQQEAALTAMFIGTTQTSTSVRTYTITPPDEDQAKIVAGRLSVTDGLVDANDLSGDPIYLEIKVTDKGELPTNEKGEEKKFPKGGLAYRIPGSADLSVTMRGNNFFRGRIDVAQYGVVFGIDPAIFSDKKAPAYVIFDGTTGSIKEIGTK